MMLTGGINSGFERLCRVETDLSGLGGVIVRKQGVNGPYDDIQLEIVIQLGGTELCAHMEFIENVSFMRMAWAYTDT